MNHEVEACVVFYRTSEVKREVLRNYASQGLCRAHSTGQSKAWRGAPARIEGKRSSQHQPDTYLCTGVREKGEEVEGFGFYACFRRKRKDLGSLPALKESKRSWVLCLTGAGGKNVCIGYSTLLWKQKESH
ncbi:hypothetical protein MA16_Dca002922 [Dendrobium catenatum]|uniref:Uncharacterized protein n=1 Tax=Dendrobium catenatum TaxID=906689 RepID=A0A2I0X914_9ASPA|nr:hypothetical protein MA16_Dca002922 [Dendrobium catenatum]